MKNPVIQEDCMGCGVACVAYVIRKSYQETLKLFPNPSKPPTEGVSCAEILSVLIGQGLRYSFSECPPRSVDVRLFGEHDSIIFFKSEQYREGHYVVSTHRGWMNPWSNFPKVYPSIIASFDKNLIGKPLYHLIKCP